MACSAVFDGLSVGIQEKIGGGDKVVSFQTLAQCGICFVQKFPGTGFELNQAVEYAFHLRHNLYLLHVFVFHLCEIQFHGGCYGDHFIQGREGSCNHDHDQHDDDGRAICFPGRLPGKAQQL